jgi:hypothetical protein
MELDAGDTFKIKGEDFKVRGIENGKILAEDGEMVKFDPAEDITVTNLKKATVSKPTKAVRNAVKKVVEENGWILDEGEWSPEHGFSMRHPETGSSMMFQRLDEIPERIADFERRRKH